MTNVKNLATGTLVYSVGNIINRFVGFLLLPVLTSFLTPADYGVIALLNISVSFLSAVFSWGFGTSIGIAYFEDATIDRKYSVIWTAFSLLLITSLVVLFAGFFGRDYLSQCLFSTKGYSDLIVIMLFVLVLTMIQLPLLLFLQFENWRKTYVVLSIASACIGLACSAVLVVKFQTGVRGMMVGSLVGQLLLTAGAMLAVLRLTSWQFKPALGNELLRLGIPLVPSFIFLFIIQQSNQYILKWFSGTGSVGIYSMGNSIGQLMNFIVAGFTSAWTPFFLSYFEKQEEARVLFGRVTTLYMLTCGTLVVMFFILAKPLIMLMTKPAFYPAYAVVGLCASAHLFYGLFSLLLPAIYFSKEVKSITLIQFVVALVSIAINLILVPRYQYMGAAVSSALSALIMAGAVFIWNRRNRTRYLNVVYEWKRLALFGGPATTVGLLFLIGRQLMVTTELLLSMIGMTFIVCWFALSLTRAERHMAIRELSILFGHQQ